ncbi:hypothetical protein SESBI_16913 [Sesbania bispinosa]|nr:hypothetical protein SESBI_16913 [Sesbania bispinosa]
MQQHGGVGRKKTPEEAIELIEIMADKNYNMAKEIGTSKKGVMELNSLDAMLAQQKILTHRINSLHAKFEGK